MFQVTMPQAGQTMEEGTIVAWLKAEGEAVKKGEVIAEIETDKAVFEFESPEGGTLLKILQPEGATVSVLTTIALIGEPGEDVEATLRGLLAAAPKPTPSESAPAPSTGAEGVQAGAVPGEGEGVELKVSPAARKLARELGVDLSKMALGTGPGGRITADDVEKFAGARGATAAEAAAGAAASAVRRPMSKMRKAVAGAMQASKQTIPHFYLRVTIDARPLLAFWEAQKAAFPCTITDVLIFAASRALMEFPQLRSRLETGEIAEFPSANIGIAVATDEGLIVPVVVGAEGMGLERIAAEARRVIDAARGGRLEGLGKGVFTITNLGMFGVEEFAAIINPPEAAILAVGAVREDVIVEKGVVHPGRVMTMTLSADHRIVDGAVAAKFAARLKGLLESPEAIA